MRETHFVIWLTAMHAQLSHTPEADDASLKKMSERAHKLATLHDAELEAAARAAEVQRLVQAELDTRAAAPPPPAETSPAPVEDSLAAGSGSAKYPNPGTTDWTDSGRPDHEHREG